MFRIYDILMISNKKTYSRRKVMSIDHKLLVSYRYSHSAWYHSDDNRMYLSGGGGGAVV